jgi:hypothetical protein
MRATPHWGQHAGRNQNDEERFVSRPSAPETQAKCKRCQRAFKRERVEQKYCGARCRNADVKARLRARSGDLKPHRRHLLLPHREAVTFGQKTPTKSKVIFDPLACNFQRPVIDLLQRGDELLKLVIYIETRRDPPRYRRPPFNGDDAVIEMDADGFPTMPAFLRRTSYPANVEPAAIECATPNPNPKV